MSGHGRGRARRSRHGRAVAAVASAVAVVTVIAIRTALADGQGQPRTAGPAVTTPSRSPGAAPSGGSHSAASPGTSASPVPSPSPVTSPHGSPRPSGTPSRGTTPSHGAPSPTPLPTPPPPGSGRLARALIPTFGAYLGAYVEPSTYTAPAEIAAVQHFQQALHHPLRLVHVYHPWDNLFPDQADRHFVASGKVLLLTWSGTPDTRQIIAGKYDALIRARALAIKHLHRPLLMEFRHEMDRPNLQWAVHGPRDFILAWDHIRAIFQQVGATNVGWVWCPTGYGFQRGRAQAFYPGNAEVDWVCADVYSYSPSMSLARAAAPFLRWAAHTGKPVIIGEFAVDGAPSSWSKWLLAAGRLAQSDPQIKAMAYFDANGHDSQGRPFHYWLASNAQAVRSFATMLGWRYFHPVDAAGM